MKQTLLPRLGAALVAVAALGLVSSSTVRAAHPASAAANPTVPFLINYQGTLQDGAGTPIATGDYELSFSIYSAASGGALLWGPQRFNGQSGTGLGPRVPVVNGRFNVVLGPVDTGNHALVDIFNQSATYVEITVGASAPIAPRQRILPTAYAFDSATLNGFTWESLFSGGNPETGTLALGLDPASVVPFSDSGVPRADISGRIRLRQGGAGSAGVWFRQDSTASDLAFMGMNGDNGVGFYSPSGPGWGLSMNLANGKVSVPGGVAVGSGINAGVNYGQWSDQIIVIGNPVRSYTNRIFTIPRGFIFSQSYPLVIDAPEKLEVYTPAAVFSGTIQAANFGPVSDERLKKDVERIQDPMDILNRIDGVTYKFDKEGEFARQSGFQLPDGRQVGVIAQAVEKALPEAVIKSPNGVLGVNYNGLTGVLIEALKQQQQQIQQLQSQLRVLQEKQRP